MQAQQLVGDSAEASQQPGGEGVPGHPGDRAVGFQVGDNAGGEPTPGPAGLSTAGCECGVEEFPAAQVAVCTGPIQVTVPSGLRTAAG